MTAAITATTLAPLDILGTRVRVDAHGRFNLNDLHQAAMASAGRTGDQNKDHQRPGKFLRNAAVQAFILTLTAQKGDAKNLAPSVSVVRGGKTGEQGTYASKLVALKYAEWLGSTAGVEFISKLGNVPAIINAQRPEFVFGEEIVERLFAGYTVIRQFPIFDGKYRIDWYIPELRIAIEFDEAHHSGPENKAADASRQADIEAALGCRFLRYRA